MRYVDLELCDARGVLLGLVRLQAAQVNPRHDYPSQPWEGCADMYLAQDELDAYLDGRSGLYGWLDSFEKTPGQRVNLSAELRGHMAQVFELCGGPREILMYPYPLGVFDEASAKTGQQKLRAHYARVLGAQPVPGTGMMRLTPP